MFARSLFCWLVGFSHSKKHLRLKENEKHQIDTQCGSSTLRARRPWTSQLAAAGTATRVLPLHFARSKVAGTQHQGEELVAALQQFKAALNRAGMDAMLTHTNLFAAV